MDGQLEKLWEILRELRNQHKENSANFNIAFEQFRARYYFMYKRHFPPDRRYLLSNLSKPLWLIISSPFEITPDDTEHSK